MRVSTLPWRLCLSGLAGVLTVGVSAEQGAPSINVAVETSFSAAPYLVELLETAAIENASSYFPLLERIADGAFAELTTHKALYDKFIDILQDEGHLGDAESISSFKLALALHAAAPRIQAHFQYYNSSVVPRMMAAQDAACPIWVHFDGQQYCSPALERAQQPVSMDSTDSELPFDHILGSREESVPSILYADITHPLFGQFHETLRRTATDGSTTYRVRYRPPLDNDKLPLYVSGYGVELNLKRTDYIVIDDRESAGNSTDEQPATIEELQEFDVADLRPLTTSELTPLGIRTAGFILSSDDPLDTLVKVSGAFPKYSSLIASHEPSKEFVLEHSANRDLFLPSGYNLLWINGLPIESRQVNAYSLLDHLRSERTLINRLKAIGLSAREAVELLSHEVLSDAQAEDDPQRYDWRDELEGGEVIIWLNDIDQDQRYAGWPSNLRSLLQRVYPGQMPQVRRDIHNLIVPVDLEKIQDVSTIVNSLQSLVKRAVPIRIGIVPIGAESIRTKASYHLIHTYGVSALLSFYQDLVVSKKPNTEASFVHAIKDRRVLEGQTTLSLSEVHTSEDLEHRFDSTQNYADRLALRGPNPPVLVNGVIIPRTESWFDQMSNRVFLDLRTVQRGVLDDLFTEDAWLPLLFLVQAMQKRNSLIVPDDLKEIKVLDVAAFEVAHKHAFDILPRIIGVEASLLSDKAHLLLVCDLDTQHGQDFVARALAFRTKHPETEILLLHNGRESSTADVSCHFDDLVLKNNKEVAADDLASLLENASTLEPCKQDTGELISQVQSARRDITKGLGLTDGETGLWLNGRLISPIEQSFDAADFEALFQFEQRTRIAPVTTAITALSLEDKFEQPIDLAKVTSIVARAFSPDLPEGMNENNQQTRMDKYKVWNGTHSSIHLSSHPDPLVQIVAAVDPASETVQHWIPILRTLSQMDGVDVTVFLNPKERLTELPIKRFYRQVIDSAPVFDEHGALAVPKASFTGVPKDVLLNLGMIVPPAWLVAPKISVHDLENIKLSSIPAGDNVDAIFELEHILIEGHSRDVSKGNYGPPPRGVQLLLGTETEPHFTDTLVMANLGYFQFKANPGFWNIALKPGRSSKIFEIESVGAKGYAAQPGDETTTAALLSFQGTTLFPRLKRKPGMDDEDVLETSVLGGAVKDLLEDSGLGGALSYFSKGASFAQSALSSIGLRKSSSGQADINIFSVASGHLYERMLNIMMVSVRRHTNHTIKFWFIEQFLSPSFKTSLPHLAAHYGFDFEMVTYKWPHWLRGQREKQREIWGYKILFLDVLFPLDLDKVIFVDADQIVRTDMMNLNRVDLQGAPYGFTPMCDSRTEMEGFRFWKQGYWANFLKGRPYHISALYVVDLKRFRELAAGDRLRQQYHALSADPASLSNLDQDLPNHMQHSLPIFSLSQEWLWCETWCSDESLSQAKTIDLCNNPLTKEPKLDRARRQVPEWTLYDTEIAEVLESFKHTAHNESREQTAAEIKEEKLVADPGKKDEL